ncbi:4-hydroxy-tetrahydrodipicolinate synthase [candidate division KSB3 bacterium]|uniref:4-hydroxy-tetrahydrodipicolinate synthase n=1 Tax=candidate division KSB3 bacterium TaxID=2044937 RepID=A0A2G6E2K9_9BACT|nr:MAG: 4-hydroxy-tetrahydrodipicolinate synthase [candidate division KSB3 bacterium]PIE29297.1 MAG: 4-hydroxy-tetrahydrodipicolinate synthase [candidate division KSB3 bacterium]
MALFKGSGVAIVTPFTDENTVNCSKFADVIEWQIKEGSDAIIVCGTTGESPTLSDSEHKEAVACAIETVNKRVPVIAGSGSNDTAYAVQLSRHAQDMGADGLLCITPYYNKPTQRGLIASFTAIADAVDIPIIMYNVPGRTGVNLLPESIAVLAKHKNLRAVKEASGNIAQVAEIARLIPEDFAMYSGNDDMVVPLMSLGGSGVISVAANIAPKDTHDMAQACLNGNIEEARRLQLSMKPLIDALFCETNPIPVKTAMNLMGLEVGRLRLPLIEMDEQNLLRLKRALRAYGLLD